MSAERTDVKASELSSLSATHAQHSVSADVNLSCAMLSSDGHEVILPQSASSASLNTSRKETRTMDDTMTESECKHIAYYKDVRENSYEHIMDLAEIDDDDRTDDMDSDVCDAMTTVLHYGTYADAAHAIRCFIKFVHATTELLEHSAL